jgi:hypothetical protein
VPVLSNSRNCLVVALILLAYGAAAAAPALTTKDCLTCHNMTPSAAQEMEPTSLYVNANLFESSVHGTFGCAFCHSDVKAFPHVPAPLPVNCGKCHGAAANEFHESIHAAEWKAQSLKFPLCVNCHGNPHGILSKSNPHSPDYALNLPRTCGRCHGSPALARRYGIRNVYALYIDSIHGFALSREGLLVAATCSSCHGAHRILSTTNPRSPIYRNRIPATCGSCHAGVTARYFDGVHGKRLKSGDPFVPVCTSCHTVHQIAEVQNVSWQVKTVATCGNCHKARLRSYRDTFHGQVTALGFVATARCWTCHRSHDILPASDPKSSVAPRNLTATCGQCHHGVTKSFVTYEPHPNPHNRKLNPALYYAAWFMNGLLLSVFAFFGIHTLLWFVRSWFESKGR